MYIQLVLESDQKANKGSESGRGSQAWLCDETHTQYFML